MRGWHGQSMRHSLAARGIVTTKMDFDSKFTTNVMIYIYDSDFDDYPLGWVDLYTDERSNRRIFGDKIPEGTALIPAIRVEDHHQKAGYGKKLLKAAEDRVRSLGMDRIWVISVVNRGFFESNGYKEIDAEKTLRGMVGTIYEKVL